jgi:choline-glycine betaine transporter
MLSGWIYTGITCLVVILLLTYLVTSADSAVLMINTINSGGDARQKGHIHSIIWGVALTSVIAILLTAGGMEALRSSMFVGALPFSVILGLMGVSLIKALREDVRSELETDVQS